MLKITNLNPITLSGIYQWYQTMILRFLIEIFVQKPKHMTLHVSPAIVRKHTKWMQLKNTHTALYLRSSTPLHDIVGIVNAKFTWIFFIKCSKKQQNQQFFLSSIIASQFRFCDQLFTTMMYVYGKFCRYIYENK